MERKRQKMYEKSKVITFRKASPKVPKLPYDNQIQIPINDFIPKS